MTEFTKFAPSILPDYQFGKRFRCSTAAGAKEFVQSDEVKRRLDAGQKMILRLVQTGRNLSWVFEFTEPSKPRPVGNGRPPVIIPRLTAKQKKMSEEDAMVDLMHNDQITAASIFLAKEQQQNSDTVVERRRVGTEVNAE